MEELLYMIGGIALIIVGAFKMKMKQRGLEAESSLSKTKSEADKLNMQFEELNKKANELIKEEIKPSDKSPEDFWKDKLQ